MNGLLIVNKEKNYTSHDVVGELRRIFHIKQIGHLGTLDPLATGVLVVCLGEATKLVPYLENMDKEYIAEITLGISSDTYDITGTIVDEKKVPQYSENKIDEVLQQFLGEMVQTPPMYSAIKVKGKKLYQYARQNQDIEVPKRNIKISNIKRLTPLRYEMNLAKFTYQVTVSKGTYVRSLCYDIGKNLGIPSLMSELTRIRSGQFSLAQAVTLDEIKDGKYQLISMLDAIGELPSVEKEFFIQKAKNGMKISLRDVQEEFNTLPQKLVIKQQDKLIAIYVYDEEKNAIGRDAYGINRF